MTCNKFLIYIAISLSILCNVVYSQDKLEIIWADAIRGRTTPEGTTVRILTGNVHLKQGNAELFCQHVKWYVEKHETILENSVKFVDPEKTLTADLVYYDDLNRITRAIGHVVVVDSIHTIHSDKAIYYELDDKIIADENVIINDNENQIELTGKHVEYLRIDEYAKIVGDPILVKKDSTGQEEIHVTGKKMEIFENGKRAVVSDSVNIFHSSGNAICEQAEFFKDENRMMLKINPVVWQKYDKLSGTEIELFFVNRELNKVVITGKAFVSSPVDTNDVTGKINRMLGDKITMLIHERKLERVLVEGKATSYYHILEDDDYKGMNKIIGDKITMHLENSEIKKINIESDPGSSDGTYFPPDAKYLPDN